MLPALAGLLIALVAVVLVLEPLIRAARGERVEVQQSLLVDDDADEDPLAERKARALTALREIEFDRATGKLSDEDYQRLYDRYSAEAVEALKVADAQAATTDAIEALISSARSSARMPAKKFCESCGARLEGAGRFCVECGVATTV